MFYNVENLFDIYDNPLKDDDEFTPDGFMRWSGWKYWKKLNSICKVITAVGEMQSPALVGLCEIENDWVLYDLTARSPLRVQEYRFIVTDSPDKRGMNVALLYQPNQFKLLEKAEYEIIFSKKNIRPTRNILHAIGCIISGDTLDIFVTHFPSRSGGQLESEEARIESATLLREKVDSIFLIRENANIIIMGDFNDNPHNRSVSKVLKAKRNDYSDYSIDPAHPPQNSTQELVNLFWHRSNKPEFGTYKFQGRWDILDQFIVSENMVVGENPIRVIDGEAYIYREDFLLEDDERYWGKKPYRTNIGPRYLGGFSDHLPIYVDFKIECDSSRY